MFKIPQNQGFAIKLKLQVFDPSTNTATPFEGEGAVVSLIGQDYQINEAAYSQKGAELTVSDVRFWKAPAGEYTLAVSVPIDGSMYAGLFHQTVWLGDRTFRPMEWDVTNKMGITVILGVGGPAPTPADIKIEGDLTYSGATAAGGALTMTNTLKLTKDGEPVDGVTFTYSSNQSWATVATDGNVTIAKNEAKEARTATITAKCTLNGKSYSKTASISQPGASAIAVTGGFKYANSAKVSAAGGSLEISENTLALTKDGTPLTGVVFTFASDQTYCTVDETTGKVTFAAYTDTTKDRTAKITASCTYEGKTYKSTSVPVTQTKKVDSNKLTLMMKASTKTTYPQSQADLDAITNRHDGEVGVKTMGPINDAATFGAMNWLILAVPTDWMLWNYANDAAIQSVIFKDGAAVLDPINNYYQVGPFDVDGTSCNIYCYWLPTLATKAPANWSIECK